MEPVVLSIKSFEDFLSQEKERQQKSLLDPKVTYMINCRFTHTDAQEKANYLFGSMFFCIEEFPTFVKLYTRRTSYIFVLAQ